MRLFSYITVGRILEELKEEFQNEVRRRLVSESSSTLKIRLQNMLDRGIVPITRATFYRTERRLGIETTNTEKGTKWRKYSREEANMIKDKIKEEYKFFSP